MCHDITMAMVIPTRWEGTFHAAASACTHRPAANCYLGP